MVSGVRPRSLNAATAASTFGSADATAGMAQPTSAAATAAPMTLFLSDMVPLIRHRAWTARAYLATQNLCGA